MITKEQALTAKEFHRASFCQKSIGPRGGITTRVIIWRRNGKTQIWKRTPSLFMIPVKHGLKSYAYITEANAELYHISDDPLCPLNQ